MGEGVGEGGVVGEGERERGRGGGEDVKKRGGNWDKEREGDNGAESDGGRGRRREE